LIISDNTGTITLPAPTGSMAALPGPTAANVTLSSTTSSGAPGGTYYVVTTYTATSNESLPGPELVYNALPGYVVTVNVSSTGAPAAATNFAAYISFAPQFEALQQSTKTTTALGSTFTAINPLTNSYGVGPAATNVSSGIYGLANTDSNEIFFSGTGGAITVGNQSLMGATNSLPPLLPFDTQGLYVTKLSGGTILEMSMRQTTYWSPTYEGTTAGIYLDSTTGFYTVDPSQSNKVLTIIGSADGVPSVVGTYGDQGKRVQVVFTAADVL
jgi:hypothetical protein